MYDICVILVRKLLIPSCRDSAFSDNSCLDLEHYDSGPVFYGQIFIGI